MDERGIMRKFNGLFINCDNNIYNRKTKVMEKEKIEKLAEDYAKQMEAVSVIDEIELENAYKAGYQKAQQEAKIVEGMKMDENQELNGWKSNEGFDIGAA